MITLSAFADEISPDLDEQLKVLRREKIRYLELRSIGGTNVLDLTDRQIIGSLQALKANGIGVSSIGSPIGKVSVDFPFEEHLARFERALQVAQMCGAPYIRMFSFYPPADGENVERRWPKGYRAEVLGRLRKMVALARSAGITLLHENEKDIYGDTVERCVDLLSHVNDPHFRAVFDPANFIQCAQVPFPEGYDELHPWISYVHVKDAGIDGKVVAAGEGLARWPQFLWQLRADGYDGFFSLEPHLASAGRFQGFSGPDLFSYASQVFQQLLIDMGWNYS